MSKDSTHTHIHFASSRHAADLWDEFVKPPHLPDEEIYVPPQYQPLNPEDEDDVVPDQHAAFGIQRATQSKRETAWKDLSVEQLLRRGPPPNETIQVAKGKKWGVTTGNKLPR